MVDDKAAVARMTVRRSNRAAANAAALRELTNQRNGVFIVYVHNYSIRKVARVEREQVVGELLGSEAVQPDQTEEK